VTCNVQKTLNIVTLFTMLYNRYRGVMGVLKNITKEANAQG